MNNSTIQGVPMSKFIDVYSETYTFGIHFYRGDDVMGFIVYCSDEE